jgi:hypothetical protein
MSDLDVEYEVEIRLLNGEYLRNVRVGSAGWECQYVDHFSRLCRLEFVDHADESVPVGKSTWMSLVGDPLREIAINSESVQNSLPSVVTSSH